MFTAVLSIVLRNWGQCRFPSPEELIRKEKVYTLKCSATVGNWIDLYNVVLIGKVRE